MKIGILSDTHNNLPNLRSALDLFERAGIDTLIHCGDLTGVEIARAMEGFHILCVLGNGDVASGEIRSVLLVQNPQNYVGLVYTGRIGPARIAATHGHLPGQVETLLHSGEYDYVFKGHSHRHTDEQVGFTRLINPGALGGLRPEDRRVCILDLESGKAKFHIIGL
jgi:putative phosphoesterase